MGGFALTTTMANRRAVWKAAGGKDQFVYTGTDGKWFINDGASMAEGQAAGWLQAVAPEPDALTPDQVQGGWLLWDGKAWVAAPNLTVKQWTAQGKAEAEAKGVAFEQQARQQASRVGDVVFEGQRAGEPGAECMGGFALTKPLKMVNRRAVWKAVDGKDQFVYVGSDGRWFINRRAGMAEGLAAGWVSAAVAEPDALTPEQVEGGWQVGDGKHGWAVVLNMSVRPWPAAESAAARLAASKRSSAGRQQALATGDVVFEAQRPGGPGAEHLGRFGLTQPLKMVNGRAVWQAAGGKDKYAFLGSDGRWFISDGATMHEGQATGWVHSDVAEPDALTPDQVTGGWQAHDGAAFVAAPGVRARRWTAADKAAAVAEVKTTVSKARQQALDIGDMVFEGQQPGEQGVEVMGVFQLTVPLQMVNRRAVWQAAGALDQFVYITGDGKWLIGTGATMREGKAEGWVCAVAAEPDALTPDQVKGGWKVGDGTAWRLAPNVSVRPWTAEDQAEAEEKALAQAQELEDKARQQAASVGDVVFVGQRPGEPAAEHMRRFALTQPLRLMGRRAVWQAASGEEHYIYVGTDGKWYVNDEANMRVGTATGWMSAHAAEPDALTPDQLRGGWQVADGTEWVAAPNVQARQWREDTFACVMSAGVWTMGPGANVYEAETCDEGGAEGQLLSLGSEETAAAAAAEPGAPEEGGGGWQAYGGEATWAVAPNLQAQQQGAAMEGTTAPAPAPGTGL